MLHAARLRWTVLLILCSFFYSLTGCSGKAHNRLVSVQISVPNTSVSRYLPQQLVAIGTYADLTTREVTADVNWISSDPTVMAVGNGAGDKGYAVPGSDGTVIITASAGSISASVNLSVTTNDLHKTVYEGVQAGPDAAMFEYPVGREWESIAKNHPYWGYKQPHLAWKSFWSLEGLYYAYEATGDSYFLNIFLSIYQALMQRQDSYQGRISWDGKVYPLWGGTSRYYGADYPLQDNSGGLLGTLTFFGNSHDQTLISTHSLVGGAFDLTVKSAGAVYTLGNVTVDSLQLRLANEIRWKSYLSPLPEGRVMDFVRATGAGTLPVRDANDELVRNITVPNVVLTGLILRPVALMYRCLKEKGDPRAESLAPCLKKAFDALVPLTWHETGDCGYFADPANSPTAYGGGSIVPWNQQAGLVAAMAIYAETDKDESLKSIVVKWHNYFMRSTVPVGSGFLWRYWNDPHNNVTWYDSTEYAGLVTAALVDIHDTHIAFDDVELAELAATVKTNLIDTYQNEGSVPRYIDGTGVGAVSSLYNYLGLSPQIPGLLPMLNIPGQLKWYEAARLLYYQKKVGRSVR